MSPAITFQKRTPEAAAVWCEGVGPPEKHRKIVRDPPGAAVVEIEECGAAVGRDAGISIVAVTLARPPGEAGGSFADSGTKSISKFSEISLRIGAVGNECAQGTHRNVYKMLEIEADASFVLGEVRTFDMDASQSFALSHGIGGRIVNRPALKIAEHHHPTRSVDSAQDLAVRTVLTKPATPYRHAATVEVSQKRALVFQVRRSASAGPGQARHPAPLAGRQRIGVVEPSV